MNEPFSGIERLWPLVRRPVTELIEQIRRATGGKLRAFTLFGPALDGEPPSERQRLESVLVLERIELDDLRSLAAQGARYAVYGMSAPLVMTPEFVRASLDSFPLELLQISQKHLTLCGPDPFADLRPADADVRLQCERELKTLEIGIHQGLLGLGDEPLGIATMVHNSGRIVRRVLLGLAWLQGVRHWQADAALVAGVEAQVGQRLPALAQALAAAEHYDWEALAGFYRDIALLRKFTDAH